jgi:hypothetical protein
MSPKCDGLSSGRFGEPGAHGPVKLFRRGMVATVEDGFKHGAALGGDRLPTLAAGGQKPFDALVFLCREHASGVPICIR